VCQQRFVVSLRRLCVSVLRMKIWPVRGFLDRLDCYFIVYFIIGKPLSAPQGCFRSTALLSSPRPLYHAHQHRE